MIAFSSKEDKADRWSPSRAPPIIIGLEECLLTVFWICYSWGYCDICFDLTHKTEKLFKWKNIAFKNKRIQNKYNSKFRQKIKQKRSLLWSFSSQVLRFRYFAGILDMLRAISLDIRRDFCNSFSLNTS